MYGTTNLQLSRTSQNRFNWAIFTRYEKLSKVATLRSKVTFIWAPRPHTTFERKVIIGQDMNIENWPDSKSSSSMYRQFLKRQFYVLFLRMCLFFRLRIQNRLQNGRGLYSGRNSDERPKRDDGLPQFRRQN